MCVCVCVCVCVCACVHVCVCNEDGYFSLQVSFWLTRIYKQAMALTTVRLSTHVRTRTVIAAATSAQKRGITTPTGTPTHGKTLQCSSRTPHCVTSTGVRVTTWSRGGSVVRGPNPCRAGTTRCSVRKMEVGCVSDAAIHTPGSALAMTHCCVGLSGKVNVDRHVFLAMKLGLRDVGICMCVGELHDCTRSPLCAFASNSSPSSCARGFTISAFDSICLILKLIMLV